MCKISEMNLETAKYYGYEAQSNQLVEECAELIQAVNKYRRVETGLGQPVAEDKKAIARDNLVEEIADVELMLEQVKYLLQIPEDELLAVKTFKVNRTRERMESWELTGAKMVVVDGENIKEDTYYRCIEGEIVEVTEDGEIVEE